MADLLAMIDGYSPSPGEKKRERISDITVKVRFQHAVAVAPVLGNRRSFLGFNPEGFQQRGESFGADP